MKRSPQILTILFFLFSALVIATNVAFSSSGLERAGQPLRLPLSLNTGTPAFDLNSGPSLFLPLIAQSQGQFSVSGKVSDQQDRPVSGVEVVDQTGRSVITGQDGSYLMEGLSSGEHALAPSKNGLVFSPAMQDVDLPGNAGPVDFTAITACTEAVTNGGFEKDTGWDFPITPYSADYSTAVVHKGSRSARTGILKTAENVYSYSSVRSKVIKVPSDIGSATLRVWLYPLSEEGMATTLMDAPKGPDFGEAALSQDVQYALVLEPGATLADDQLLETLLWIRSDSQTWMMHEFDLTKYAGQSIKLQFGTFNDGANGVTAMFVDDVSLEICGAAVTTPTPTPTGTPTACQNRIDNSGFELNGSWDIPVTVFPAGYTTARAHTGKRSMRTGIVKTADDRYSFSDAGQWVTIPSKAASVTLRLWEYPASEEATTLALPAPPAVGSSIDALEKQLVSNDVQYVLILDQNYNIAEVLLWQLSNAQKWVKHEFDLSDYKGRTIRVQFGTFNDGYYNQGITSMYVDDVTLDTCTTAAPTPTPTATPSPTATPINSPTPTNTPQPGTTPTATSTPTGCSDRILNGSFEDTSDWVIPITAFSAGYSTDRAHSGDRSMRTGIVHAAHNRFSYSDFRQTVTIPWDAKSALVRFWLYPRSQDAALLSVPSQPLSDIFGQDALNEDVQYVLILNAYGNWIDTLVWQRSNAGTWTSKDFDLDKYIGSTIKLQFGTYNDGLGGVTYMYVDDVSLQVCK